MSPVPVIAAFTVTDSCCVGFCRNHDFRDAAHISMLDMPACSMHLLISGRWLLEKPYCGVSFIFGSLVRLALVSSPASSPSPLPSFVSSWWIGLQLQQMLLKVDVA